MVQKYGISAKFSKKIEISVYHLLILIINQRELCAKLGITPAYSKHFPMFLEYIENQRKGDKKTYLYRHLGEKYGMHESSVRRVISSLLRTVSV